MGNSEGAVGHVGCCKHFAVAHLIKENVAISSLVGHMWACILLTFIVNSAIFASVAINIKHAWFEKKLREP